MGSPPGERKKSNVKSSRKKKKKRRGGLLEHSASREGQRGDLEGRWMSLPPKDHRHIGKSRLRRSETHEEKGEREEPNPPTSTRTRPHFLIYRRRL